ncbi:hypothetical protein [Agrobacterium deltaense]|uniref:hypothetical protein n=1 Tax=Agrobacterium deltaense TaxID=1183412 RepID=UPI0013C4E6F2|nr:hypothetical protein [Agrobacterium deltaense]
MLSALFLCPFPDGPARSQVVYRRIPVRELASQKSICPKGRTFPRKDNACCEIGQENSEHHAKHYSDARFPWVARQPAGQRQGKNGEQRQQCKFCERCAELQDNSLLIDRLLATVAFLEKSDETVRTGRSGTAPSKPSPI